MNIQSTPRFTSYNTLNNQMMTNDYSSNISFGVGPKSNFFRPVKKVLFPASKAYHKGGRKVTNAIANGLGKMLDTKICEKFVNAVKGSKKLTSHLAAFTSLVLSSFYISQTLKNDKLDSEKRKTLAINQGATCALSTVLAYKFDGWAKPKVTQFTNKFMAVNLAKEAPKKLDMYSKGIGAAASLMIFGTMYRFIAPVLVTPIANTLGNKLNEKKHAKAAQKLSTNA